MSQDTIFALATGVGRSAVAIIRVSGPQVSTCLNALIGSVPVARQAVLKILKGEDGPIDQALVLYFPAPHSFTGEDLAEFQVHGSQAVIARLLKELSGFSGFRLAEAGEFSRRALLNGKLDLAHIEGLIDLISAETELQRKQALHQMQGALSEQIHAWRQSLLQLMALVESEIDFSDEGDVSSLQTDHLIQLIGDLIRSFQAVLAQSQQGIRLRDGLNVVVAGPPNAGKSSLVNYLARKDVAIVSPHAGTTRDLIEIPLQIDGYPICLIDTAGLRESSDPVEQEGIQRAMKRAREADLGLWLTAPDQITSPPSGPDWILVRTKADLFVSASGDDSEDRSSVQDILSAEHPIHISVQTGQGIEILLDQLKFQASQRLGSGHALVTRQRQQHALSQTVEALFRAQDCLKQGAHVELAAEDLRMAARSLGSVIGVVGVEDILDRLFSDFCIGK